MNIKHIFKLYLILIVQTTQHDGPRARIFFGVENLLKVEVPFRAKVSVFFIVKLRVFESFTRVNYACTRRWCLTPFLWGFEEREKLMEFTNASRAHVFIPVHQTWRCCTRSTLWFIRRHHLFIEQFYYRIDEIREMLLRIAYGSNV